MIIDDIYYNKWHFKWQFFYDNSIDCYKWHFNRFLNPDVTTFNTSELLSSDVLSLHDPNLQKSRSRMDTPVSLLIPWFLNDLWHTMMSILFEHRHMTWLFPFHHFNEYLTSSKERILKKIQISPPPKSYSKSYPKNTSVFVKILLSSKWTGVTLKVRVIDRMRMRQDLLFNSI